MRLLEKLIGTDIPAARSVRVMLWLILLLCLIHPLLYVPGLRNVAALPRYTWLALTATLLGLAWGIAYWRGAVMIRWNMRFTLIVLLLLWSIASLTWTVDMRTGFVMIVEMFALVVLALSVGQILTWSLLRVVSLVSIAAASLVAVLGIWQNFGFNPLGVAQYVPPAALFTNKNFVAVYLDLVVPFALLEIFLVRRQYFAWLAATAFGLILALEIVIRSRGSWLGLSVGLLVLLVLLIRNASLRAQLGQVLRARYRAVLFSLAIVAGVALAPSAVFGNLFDYRVMNFEQSSSAAVRLNAYLNSTRMILDHPWRGVGLGGFMIGFRPYMHAARDLPGLNEDIYLTRLHSDPLQSIVETGLIGGALLIALWLSTLWRLWRTSGDESSGLAPRYLSLGLLLALLIGMIHACVDFPMHLPSSSIQFWLWLGGAAGLTALTPGTTSMSIRRSVLALLCGAFALYGVFAVYFFSAWLRASADLQQALQAAAQRDCAHATQWADRSVQRFPFDYQSRHYRVQIYSGCLSIAPQRLLNVMSEELAVDPYNARALLIRGWILANNNYIYAAEQDYRQVTRLLPSRASGFIGLGQLAQRQNNMTSARTFYAKALQLEPDNALAVKLLHGVAVKKPAGSP
jgi:O-antigen ligase